MNKLIEYTGTLFAILGAILLAVNIPESKWAFVLFTAGGPLLAFSCWRNKLYGIFTLQLAYLVINIIGIYKWIF